MAKKKVCSICGCASRDWIPIYYGFQKRFHSNVCFACRVRNNLGGFDK